MEHMLCKTIESAMLEKMMNHGILRCIVQLKSQKKNCGSADEKKVSQTIEMCPMLLIKYVLCTLIWLVLVTLRSLNEFDTLIYYLLFLFIQVKNDCPPLQIAKDIIHSQFCKKQKKMLKINSKCSVHVQ